LDLQGNFKHHQVSKTTVRWKNVHFLSCLNQCWGGYLILFISAGSGLLNIRESENHWFWVSESNNCQFLLFQKPQRPAGFH
jgi:hypothetical protein